MQQSFKRILSLVLTFAMVLSCVPAQVLATETCDHSYDMTVTGAGCTEEGSVVYTCSACGDSYEEEIAAAGHNYEQTASVEAACGEAGSVTYTCSACGDSYTEETPATGDHAYAEGVCAVCGAADPDAVPAEEPTEAPTEEPAEEPVEEPTEVVLDMITTEVNDSTQSSEGDGGDIPIMSSPVYVAEVNTDKYESLEEAIAAAATITTNRPAIYVLADCTVEETVQINTDITLIYAGEGTVPTITVEQVENSVFEVVAGGALVLENVTVKNNGKIAIQGGGSLEICGTLEVANGGWLESHGDVTIAEGGKLEIQSGANMLNCGEVTNDGGQFINDGCVMDCFDIKNTITSSGENSEYYKYDPLQMELFAAMDAKEDYTWTENHTLTGNLSVHLNDQGQNKLFTLDAARIIVPSGKELRIRSRALVQNKAEIIVEEDGRLLIEGELTFAGGTWLESRGQIVIKDGGKLELQAGAEMVNHGTITNNGEFINDGFINDFVGIPAGTITGGEGDCRLYDNDLQLELFQAMGKSGYTLKEDYTLKGDLSIPLGDELFVLDGARLYVPADCILYVRSDMRIINGGDLIVQEGSKMVVEGTLEIAEGSWLESWGEIEIDGGTLHILGGGEFLNCGTMTIKNGQFINDGCIDDLGAIRDLITEDNGEYYKYDGYLQQELFDAMNAETGYTLSGEDYTLSGNLSIALGGQETENGWEDNIFVIDNVTLTVPSGCTLSVRSHVYLKGENAKLVVENGGKVVASALIHEGSGTVYLKKGAQVEDNAELYWNPAREGEIQDFLSAHWLYWEDGHYNSLEVVGSEPVRTAVLQPGNNHAFIFYLNTWDSANERWVRTPVPMEDLSCDDALYLQAVETESIAPDVADSEYYYRLYAEEDSELWTKVQYVRYAPNADVDAVQVEFGLETGMGIYSEPEASFDSYLREIVYVPGEENSFYFINTDPNVEMIDVELTARKGWKDEDGKWIEEEIDAANIVKYADNIWKIALKKSATEDLGNGFRLFLDITLRNNEGGSWKESREIECNPWTHRKAKFADASFKIDGVDYNYFAKYDQYTTYDQENDRDVPVTLPDGVSYDVESNTFFLENVQLDNLHINYSYFDTYWQENCYCLPTKELTIHLSGENRIIGTNENECSLGLMDSLEGGMKVKIVGDGSLYLHNGDGIHAADIQFTDLTIGENVHVTFAVEGERYWDNGNPATLHGLNGCETSTLTITDSAVVNFEVPELRVNRQGTPFEYRGLANFKQIVVDQQAVLNLDVLHLYNGQKFLQRGGTVNVEDYGAIEESGRRFYEPVHVDGRSGENGPASLLNISGGVMNVKAYDEDTNARTSMIQVTNGATMQVSGGKLNIGHNVLGSAIFVGYGARLYYSGGLTTWSDELYEGYNREQYSGNTFISVQRDATASFTGGTIRVTGGESYLNAWGNLDEGVYGIKWVGTTLEANNTRIYLDGGQAEEDDSFDDFIEGSFLMSGGRIDLKGGSCFEVRGAQAVFTGGVVNMTDSMLKNGNVVTVDGNAVLNFSVYDNTQTPVGYEEPFAIENNGYMPVSGNGRININIDRREDNWATGIRNNGSFHQMGGIVTINSNVRREMIQSWGDILLNAGEMNLDGVTGMDVYWNEKTGEDRNCFEMQEGMTLNIDASRSGLNLYTDAYINGGSLNIRTQGTGEEQAYGLYALDGAQVVFNGGIHRISATSVSEEEYIYGAGLLVDNNVSEERPNSAKITIKDSATVFVEADRAVAVWKMGTDPNMDSMVAASFVDTNSGVSLTGWTPEYVQKNDTYNYYLSDGYGGFAQNIRNDADSYVTLQEWLENAELGEDARYHLGGDVLVTESMTLVKDDQSIILDVHGKLTVRDGAVLTVPEGAHLVANGGTIQVEAGSQIENYGLMANDSGTILVRNGSAKNGYIHGEEAILNVHFAENQIPVMDENGEPTEEEKWELHISKTSGIPVEYQKFFGNVTTADGLSQIARMAADDGYCEVGINLEGNGVEIHEDLTIPENTTLNINANYVLIADDGSLTVEGSMNLNEASVLDVGGTLENYGVIEAYGASIDLSGTYCAYEDARMSLYNSGETISTMDIIGYYDLAGQNAVLEIVNKSEVTVNGTLENRGEVRVGGWQEVEGYVPGTLNINGAMEIYGFLFISEAEEGPCGVVNVNEGGSILVKRYDYTDIYGSIYVGGEMNVAGTLEIENYMDIRGKATVTGIMNNYGMVVLYGELAVNGGTLNNGRSYSAEIDGSGWYGEICLLDDEDTKNTPKLTVNGGEVKNIGSIGNYSPNGSIDLSGGTYTPGQIKNPEGNTLDGEIVVSYFSDNTIAVCNDALKQYAYLLYEGNNATTAIKMAAAAEPYKEDIVYVVGKMTVDAGQVLQTDNIIITQGSELVVNGKVTAWEKLNIRSSGKLTIGANGAVYAAKKMQAFPADEEAGYGASVIQNRGTLECGAAAYMQIDGQYSNFGVGTLMKDAEFDKNDDFICGTICDADGNTYHEYQTLSVVIQGENGAENLRSAINEIKGGEYRDGILWLRTEASVSKRDLTIPENVTLHITGENENVGSLHLENCVLYNEGEIYVNLPNQALTASGQKAKYTGSGDYYGTCSVDSDLTWNVRAGVLTISGKGAIPDYTKDSPAPWNFISYQRVELGTDVTGIGDYAFVNGGEATVTIPKSVTGFGDNCFGEKMYLKVYHNSEAEDKYLDDHEHDADRITFIHTMNAQGVCEGCEENMLESMNNAQPKDVAEELKNIDTGELKSAMEENTDIVTLVAEKEKELLQEKSYSSEEKLTVSTNSVASDEKITSAFGQGEVAGADIVGAAMNAPDATGRIDLIISDPKDATLEDEQFEKFDTDASVLFSMNLSGVGNDSTLEIPVIITLPIPQSVVDAVDGNLENIVVMHYHEGNPDGEQVKVNPYWDEDGNAYVSFVVSGFSNFLVGVMAEEVSVKVMVNKVSEATVTTETDPEDIMIKYDVRGEGDRKVTDIGLYYIIQNAEGKEVTLEDAVNTPGTYTVKSGYENAGKYYITQETFATLNVVEPTYVCEKYSKTTDKTDKYESLSEALSAAASGETVTLLQDTTESYVIIAPGVTLNLQNYSLTADRLVGFNGSFLTATTAKDGSGGKLIVPKGNIILSEQGYTNETGYYILPIWDNASNCYLFSLFNVNTKTTNRGLYINRDNKEEIYFQFKHEASGEINRNLLIDGADNNELKIVIMLEWTDEKGAASQEFVYNDGFVGKVADTKNKYDYTFTLTNYSALNINIETLSVQARIVTNSGATAFGTVWNQTTAKK